MSRLSCIDREGSKEKETLSCYKTKNVFIKITETQDDHEWGTDLIN